MKEKDEKYSAEANGNEPGVNQGEEIFNLNSDSDVPGSTNIDESVSIEGETEKLQAEISELKDKYLRQAAEFDNFRKRSARERLELIQTAGKDVIVSLLDVLDDCDRAQSQFEKTEDIKALKEGVFLIFSKLRSTVSSKGVKPMISVNEEFNPDLHEAITEIPAPEPSLKGKVLDEVQKGYLMNDKIIRFAKVVVGK